MLGRRLQERGEGDRRDLPRPSLRLNLILLGAALAALGFAVTERRDIDARWGRALDASADSPELGLIKAELAGMGMTREALARELDGRAAYLQNGKSRDFYLSIDTARSTLSLNFGDDTVRDARLLSSVSLRGAFTVAGKEADGALFKFVIRLPNGHAIHSPPRAGAKRAGPGSFTAPEADLAAIWDRISTETRVYIF